MTSLAAGALKGDRTLGKQLVQSVGGLPLALTLLGNYIHIHALRQTPEALSLLLATLHEVAVRLEVAQPLAPLEQHPSLPSQVPISLAAMIAITSDALAEPIKHTLFALSTFPAKPNTFSREAACVVTDAPQTYLDQLLASGLMMALDVHEAPLVSPSHLERVHSPEHVEAMFASVPNQGLVHVDPDTAMNPYTLTAALRAAGAAVLSPSNVTGLAVNGTTLQVQWRDNSSTELSYSVRLTDAGPYRAIRATLLHELNLQESTFGWPTEMTVKAAKRKARIVEVPISWHSRRTGVSKVGGTLRGSLLASYHILRITLRYTFE